MTELRYDVRREDGRLVIVPEGELDMRVAPRLRQVLQDELAQGPSEVIVDLRHIGFIDSSIIATLVGGLKLARKKGGTLRVTHCRPAVRDTFEIARLLDVFGIE